MLLNCSGWRSRTVVLVPDGRVGHAELSVGDSVISLGLASTSRVVDRPTRSTLAAMTLVFVDDVDVRAEQAVAAGGDLIDPPTTQPWGVRQAIAADPEDHGRRQVDANIRAAARTGVGRQQADIT